IVDTDRARDGKCERQDFILGAGKTDLRLPQPWLVSLDHAAHVLHDFFGRAGTEAAGQIGEVGDTEVGVSRYAALPRIQDALPVLEYGSDETLGAGGLPEVSLGPKAGQAFQ